jgi:class 3 adenylate cyclase/tetratricopeptide (TPR) repeat protein
MVNNIQSWLEGMGLHKYVEVFAENEIDLDAAQYLTDEDLKELGLPLGPRKKVLASIQKPEMMAVVAKGAEDAAPLEAERRQLTVLFCDLVGSTALSARLDPEDMREVLHRYQDAVAGVVSRHDGYVANYLGDGVLAYFGWPRAHEDQAAQAVRAGLAAVGAVASILTPEGEGLMARVGIATGQVVVGDLKGESGRQSAAISGETPNLAARLQSLAEPGQVLIGGLTQNLLGRQFDLADLGSRELKGITGAVPAWRVRGEVEIESRFEARAGDLVEFVGREHELGLLIDRWRLAGNGEGQVVLLSGEAGIGKSRLIEELRRRTAREDVFRLTYQCAPQYANSAFWPVILHLRRAADFQPGDTSSAQLDKLEALVNGDREAAQLLAVLLSLSGEDRYGALELSPQAHKQRTIEALVRQLLALEERKPVLFLFEDAHWIDPSSTELLSEIVGRIADARVLMVVTTRPEWQAPWGDQPHSTLLSLSRLGRSQAADIVAAIAGPHVDADAIERVVSRTDGIPLFVEELTKVLVERGLDALDANIPATLQASLAARLDRLLPEAREIAQIGAVIGRRFPVSLLAALLSQEAASLAGRIDALLESGLLYRQGAGNEAVLTFKHALVQDTAYASLLVRRRRELHAAVAVMLCNQDAGGASVPAELIAHHLTEAGKIRDAIIYWQQGAEAALKRSAYSEAHSQLRRGLDLLAMLPESPDRMALELSLQITLGPVLMITRGQTAVEVMHTYARARVICEELQEERRLGPILIGLWRCQISRGIHDALATAEEALRIARHTKDRMLTVAGLMAVGTAHYHLGEMIAARNELENGLSVYRTLDHVRKPGLYVRDPGVICLAYLANVLWALGYPDQAQSRAQEGIDLARVIDHPLSLAHAHWQASLVNANRGDWQLTANGAETVLHLTREHDLGAWYMANGVLLRSRALAHEGRSDDALAQLTEALKIYGRTAPMSRVNQMLAAEIHLFAGDAAQGLAMIDGQPSADWLRGELLLHLIEPEVAAAERAFHSALVEARTRSSRSLELRAALSLARLWREQGHYRRCRDLLTPIVEWFTEGFETQDLVGAEALLRDVA